MQSTEYLCVIFHVKHKKYRGYYLISNSMKSNKEWSSQFWTQFMQLRKKPKNYSDFSGFNRDLAIPARCSNQLSYEATDDGNWFDF